MRRTSLTSCRRFVESSFNIHADITNKLLDEVLVNLIKQLRSCEDVAEATDQPFNFRQFRVRIERKSFGFAMFLIVVSTCRFLCASEFRKMNQNIYNNRTLRNGSQSLNDDQTHTDAVSPRFRTDLTGQEVNNFCYSCKSEFTTRSVHDLMEHYSQPHERFSSLCLYCKTGKVHQYKSDAKGLQFYHDCYRSKMNYDK